MSPACISCGCTEDNACPGGCTWVSLDPPLCSACAEPDELEASTYEGGGIACAHSWLYTTTTDAHCVHCGAERHD